MKNIKIKADNLQDFKKQYFNNGNFDVINSLIKLQTSNEFWKEISEKEIKQSMVNICSLLKEDAKNKYILENFDKCNFVSFYLPSYGHIERIKI